MYIKHILIYYYDIYLYTLYIHCIYANNKNPSYLILNCKVKAECSDNLITLKSLQFSVFWQHLLSMLTAYSGDNLCESLPHILSICPRKSVDIGTDFRW